MYEAARKCLFYILFYSPILIGLLHEWSKNARQNGAPDKPRLDYYIAKTLTWIAALPLIAFAILFFGIIALVLLPFNVIKETPDIIQFIINYFKDTWKPIIPATILVIAIPYCYVQNDHAATRTPTSYIHRVKPTNPAKRYWINNVTHKTHNYTCQYYCNCDGHYSSTGSGNDCLICGGAM